MSMSGKGLGRGLDALFQVNQVQSNLPAGGNMENSPFQIVSPDALSPNPGQPRENFDDASLRELAASIKERGILQPLIVRPASQPGSYQIIAGERRWRAARLAGVHEIPIIVNDANDQDALTLAIIENIQREDLNPIEYARGLVTLKELLGINQDMLAEKLGKQKGTISNQIRLLRLPQEAQDDLVAGRMTSGHARCLLSLSSPEDMEELRVHILKNGMTVRNTEDAVNYWRDQGHFAWQKDSGENPKKIRPPELKHFAEEIGARYECATRISGDGEKGKISITYESREQLEKLLNIFGITKTEINEEN